MTLSKNTKFLIGPTLAGAGLSWSLFCLIMTVATGSILFLIAAALTAYGSLSLLVDAKKILDLRDIP